MPQFQYLPAGQAGLFFVCPGLLYCICLQCVSDLPHTNFAMHTGNPVEKIFWERLAITAAMSEFYFTKGTMIQTLIHEFKYKGNTDVLISWRNDGQQFVK